MIRETDVDVFEDNFEHKWYNRLLHELGHAHLLNHSINPSIPQNEEYIMIADLSNFNNSDHTIRPDDETGAETLFQSSADLLDGCASAFPIFEGVNCDDVNTTENLTKHLINLSLFPNPVNKEKFNLNIEINNIADVELEIVNLLGQKIINRSLGTLSIGEHTISCSLPKKTPAGNYFVKLYVEEELITLKLLRI